MKVIKGKVFAQGIPIVVYFVDVVEGKPMAWSTSLEDAACFENDDTDVEEIVASFKQMDDLEVENIQVMETNEISKIFVEEFVPIAAVLNREFVGITVNDTSMQSVFSRFRSLVQGQEFPDEYLAGITIKIEEGKIIVNLPENDDIMRVRTLH